MGGDDGSSILQLICNLLLKEQHSKGHNQKHDRHVWAKTVSHHRALIQEGLVELGAIPVVHRRLVLANIGRGTDGEQQHEDCTLETKDGAHFSVV